MSILHYLKNMKTDCIRSSDPDGRDKPSSHSNMIDVYDVFTDGSEIKHSKTHKTLAVGWSFVIFKNKVLNIDTCPTKTNIQSRKKKCFIPQLDRIYIGQLG